jgi:hypothetical protein
VLATSTVRAATCTWDPGFLGTAEVGGNWASGDNAIIGSACTQANIGKFWDDFNFDKGDWDDGMGFEAPCDVNRPLARTFSALYVLKYLADDFKTAPSHPLHRAYGYASGHIDELDARCGSGHADQGPRATTYTGAFVDDRTVLKWPFFYGENVIQRAGTIVHEAVHADGVSHDGASSCPRGKSCDSSWTYYGANTRQVIFLWDFCMQGTRATTAMKEWARSEAQDILDQGFVAPPGYYIPPCATLRAPASTTAVWVPASGMPCLAGCWSWKSGLAPTAPAPYPHPVVTGRYDGDQNKALSVCRAWDKKKYGLRAGHSQFPKSECAIAAGDTTYLPKDYQCLCTKEPFPEKHDSIIISYGPAAWVPSNKLPCAMACRTWGAPHPTPSGGGAPYSDGPFPNAVVTGKYRTSPVGMSVCRAWDKNKRGLRAGHSTEGQFEECAIAAGGTTYKTQNYECLCTKERIPPESN